MKKVLSVLVLLLVCGVTYAGGYRVSLQGQRSLAMGHTGVAVVNNAELAFFNPAGLVYLENKLNIAAGVSGVFSDVAFQNSEFGQQAQTDSPTGTPFYFYASYAVSESISVGLAAYTPFGSSVEYEQDWAGSHLVNNIELAAIYIQPLLSVKLGDVFSFGGGPIYVSGSVNFNRNLNRTLTDIDGNRSNVTLDASGVNAWGWSAGIMFNPTDDLHFGMNYRSRIDVEVENGDATFANVPNSPLAPVANGTVGFDATLPLPAEWTVGMSYELGEKWTFAFDYNLAVWSAYQSLDIDFLPEDVPDSVNPRNYDDASTYRFGVQYVANSKITLRAGYYFDETPVQEGFFAPETPRNDSHGFTGGLSFNVSDKFSIDASFLYLRFEEVDASYNGYTENGEVVPFGGTYKSSAFVPGLGVSYKL
ncbi:MAG: outer membrane protein transport protein [Dokdonia sp.]|jgi:long-chain fatty acid transport protein|nr:transporter [Cytophagaceae bacterium]